MPVGITTSTASPLALPIKARAIGEFIDIFPLCALASGSPTIRHTWMDVTKGSNLRYELVQMPDGTNV
jgi:hypothetical protein